MKSQNPSVQPSVPTDVSTASSSAPSDTPVNRTAATVKDMAEQAKRKAGDVLGQAKDRAASMASEQKQSAAEHINRYSSALRDSAKRVEDQDPNIAYYANRAAEGIERVAEYVRNTDFQGLQRDAEDLARRRPALFMGGLFVAGLVLGGLVKASAKTLREDAQASSFDDASGYFPRDDEPLAASTPGTGLASENLSQTSASL